MSRSECGIKRALNLDGVCWEPSDATDDICWYSDYRPFGMTGTIAVVKKGLRVKLPINQELRSWYSRRVRVEVGFSSGAVFIRPVDGRNGFRVNVIGMSRLWSAMIGNERLVELMQAHGFDVGNVLVASWDAERGWIKGEGVIGWEG